MIKNSNGIIKISANRHLGNTSILNEECMALRDDKLVT